MRKLSSGVDFLDKRTGERIRALPPRDREINLLLACVDEILATPNGSESHARALAKASETARAVRDYLNSGWRKANTERTDGFSAWRQQCVGTGTKQDFLAHSDLYGSYLKWCHATGTRIASQNALTRWIGQDRDVHVISKERRGVYGLTLLAAPDESETPNEGG